MEKKIILLTLIKEKKEILFGKFSDILTFEDKKQAWIEVTTLGKSLAIIPNDKDWTYARDTTFSNWKARTLAKKDNRNKTGTGGGLNAKLTDLDQLILDIIGKDSPIVEGLSVPETWNSNIGNENTVSTVESSLIQFAVPSTSTVQCSTAKSFPLRSEYEKAKEKRKIKFNYDEEVRMKKKEKLDLQIDLLKIEKRRKTLELYKLEQELGFPSSDLTTPFSTSFVVEIDDGLTRD